MKTVLEPQKEVSVFEEADVTVGGGGPAGIGAALSAARNGAKTIVIEKFGAMGKAVWYNRPRPTDVIMVTAKA